MESEATGADDRKSSNLQIFLNIIRALIGMGTLTLPKAYARTGLIPACLISIIVPVLSRCALGWAVSLKEAQREGAGHEALSVEMESIKEAKKPEEDPFCSLEEMATDTDAPNFDAEAEEAWYACFGGFDATVEKVLGRSGRASFIAAVMAAQYSTGVSYISAIEEGIRTMLPSFSQTFGLIVVAACLVVLTLLAPTLRDISWLSLLSTLVLLYIFITMPIQGLRDEEHRGQMVLWNSSAGFLDYGFVYGAVAFCYCDLALGLCLYEDMRQKEHFGSVVTAAWTSSVLISATFGIVGYWAFGGHATELVYLNFPAGSTSSYLCIVSYTIILSASYLLLMTPVFLFVRGLTRSGMPYGAIRCALIVLTALCSKFLPSVMDAILLCTAITTQFSDLMIPALCILSMASQISLAQRALACFGIVMGSLGGVAGFLSAFVG